MKRFVPILLLIHFLLFIPNSYAQLEFEITNSGANVNEFVTVDVRARNFNDIIGLQFGMTWDNTQLQFLDTRNYGLPNLNENSFGIPGVGSNELNELVVSWIELTTINPVTLADDSILFSIRFRVLTEAQSHTKVAFSDNVSIVEVLDIEQKPVPIYALIDGTIITNNPTQLNTPIIQLDSLKQPTCSGSDGLLNVSVTGGIQPYTLSWNGPGGFTSSSSNISDLSAGIYRLDVMDGTGRIYCANFRMNSPGSFLNLQLDSECTQDGNGRLSVRAQVGSNQPFLVDRFEWSNGQIEQTNRRNSTIFVPFDKGISVTVFDQEGCSFTSPMVLPVSLCSDLVIDTVNLVAPDTLIRFNQDTFVLPIRANKISDLNELALSMNWDTSAVELVGYALDESFKDAMIDLGEGQFGFSWTKVAPVGQIGEIQLFSLIFKTKSFPSSTTIAFSDDLKGSNVAENFVSFEAKDATISYGLWPGDTDRDGIVGIFDLFNIGFGFGETGPARINSNTNWELVRAIDWPKSTPASGVNYAFADTDGNGLINAADVEVILQNFGRSHPGAILPEDIIDPRSNQGAPLSIVLDTLITGNEASLPINLGSQENPVSSVYSLGFSITYDALFYDESSIQLDLSNSWLAEDAANLIAIVQAVPEASRIDVAISRTDGQDISGFGEIARLEFNVLEQISFNGNESILNLGLMGTRAQDVNETPFAISTSSSIVEVMTSSRLKVIPSGAFSIFPVPTSNSLYLNNDQNLSIQTLRVVDSRGRIVEQINAKESLTQLMIDTRSYANGTYFLQIYTEEGFAIKKFLIQKD
ncbi:MAG: T9SS type A sorting domain-containing protein [Bacteroidota bacterium]